MHGINRNTDWLDNSLSFIGWISLFSLFIVEPGSAGEIILIVVLALSVIGNVGLTVRKLILRRKARRAPDYVKPPQPDFATRKKGAVRAASEMIFVFGILFLIVWNKSDDVFGKWLLGSVLGLAVILLIFSLTRKEKRNN